MRRSALLERAGRLVARTAPLPDSLSGIDPMDVGGAADALFWRRDGLVLGARGRALQVPLPAGLEAPGTADDVLEALLAIKVEDDVARRGSGPLALGSLPFDRRRPGRLVVPAVLVGADAAGHRWLTTVAPVGEAPSVDAAAVAAVPAIDPPDRFSLISARTHPDWREEVARAVAAIRGGRFRKVVLAREVRVRANRPLVPADILRRLQALYPSCTVFGDAGFLGASPELLVSRAGREVASHPLAGTVPRSGDPAADDRLVFAMLASAKERHEHRLVVDAVAGALSAVCDRLDVPDVPAIVSLRNVSHLGTRVQGMLAGREPPTALQLVARLHPTPAVAGTPTAEALTYLEAAEGFDRRGYAGPVGWMDSSGDGEWAVGIRSAEVRGTRARLVAGVGLVADSDAESELAETQLKLQALLAAVVRP